MLVIRSLAEARTHLARRRSSLVDHEVEDAVRAIVEDVRARGDDAVREATQRFDRVDLVSLVVPDDEVMGLAEQVDARTRNSIDAGFRRITAYYEQQQDGVFESQEQYATLGQLIRPIGSIGIYIPGGTAPLFSTVLMTGIPARVAGVERIVVATPPTQTGAIPAEVAYAAKCIQASEVVRVGGAQAIAALAYGTQTVRAVDKIVGPGNAYVVAAKRMVFGAVGIEALPGPTETLVLASPEANPSHAASDLLAQAEHLDAQPVLVTWSEDLMNQIFDALDAQLADLPEPTMARLSIENRGLAFLVANEMEAIEVANLYAPEHLCLLTADPWSLVPHVQNAGGIFLGDYSMEALGDYMAGPSHVMPTGGTARFASFVNVRDFQKVIPYVSGTAEWVRAIGPDAVVMARAEGLEAHARAIESRLHSEDDA